MTKNSIMVDLDDPKAARIAEVISNKTAKRILGLLAESEMDASEISSKLAMPLNTVGYNLKKLVDSGLVEKSKNYLWSAKGNKIERYKVSEKRIVIMPRRVVRGILPSVIISAVVAVGLKLFWGARDVAVESLKSGVSAGDLAVVAPAAESAARAGEFSYAASNEAASKIVRECSGIFCNFTDGSFWIWFLAGALFGLLVYWVWNFGVFRKR
jgi:DNA-binding transcriptional ArsR family regulator